MYLVLGLGNPGRRYEQTRHNVGFLVADRLAARWDGSLSRMQFGALTDKIRIGTLPVVVAKPQSFMNRSGHPAASLKGFYKVEADQMVVVHDDVDIEFGQVRVKRGGGHGGHNGLRDIQTRVGGNGFLRVRVGVSRPPSGWDTADYVLGKWSTSEDSELDGVVDTAANVVEVIVRAGATEAMNRFNVRPRPDAAHQTPVATLDGVAED